MPNTFGWPTFDTLKEAELLGTSAAQQFVLDTVKPQKLLGTTCLTGPIGGRLAAGREVECCHPS